MADNEYTAKKIVLKKNTAEGVQYLIPFVPNGTAEEPGLAKADGVTTTISNGVISVADNVYATKTEMDDKFSTLIVYRQW